MSSYLEKQQAAFRGDLKAVAPKLGGTAVKRTLAVSAQPSPAASPAPSDGGNSSQAAASKDGKRKRDGPGPSGIWSQPQETGVGNEINTQVMYAIDYMKRKDEPKSIHDVFDYMNMHNAPEQRKKMIVQILKNHPKASWSADPASRAWDAGKYSHRSTLAMRNGTDLVAYLQKRPDAMGTKIADVKDGWPDCDGAVEQLESEHRVLATRTKKDNKARMLWSDDPSLYHGVDDDFKLMWHKIDLPGVDDLVRKLQDAGQKPASEDPAKRIKAPPVQQQKKKKSARKNGKMTNTHIAHLLKPLVRK